MVNHAINYVSVLSTVYGVVWVGLITTIGVDAPVEIVLGEVGVRLGGVCVGLNIFCKSIVVKLKKHDSLTALASAKLSSIKLFISKALSESKISVEEINTVQSDVDYTNKTGLLQRYLPDSKADGVNSDDLKHNTIIIYLTGKEK